MGKEFQLDRNGKTFIIAEVGQAHDGSLGIAHSYIDAISEAGADAVKFQTHFASEESTYDDKFRINFSNQDANRYEYWERMEFSKSQWKELYEHAKDKKLIFLSSAFSDYALKMLIELGIPAIKVASGEANISKVIDEVSKYKLPVLLSTGMSSYSDINSALLKLNKNNIPVVCMQCTSKYPTSLKDVGLNVIDEFKKRFNVPVGLSDHSGTIYPSLSAIARKVDVLEVHVTFDKRLFGPDTQASITIDELKLLSNYRNALSEMDSNPVDKNKMADSLSDMRKLFFKSLAPKKFLKKGTVITKKMLTLKKPGTGIHPDKINEIIGKRLNKDVRPDQLLKLEDCDE